MQQVFNMVKNRNSYRSTCLFQHLSNPNSETLCDMININMNRSYLYGNIIHFHINFRIKITRLSPNISPTLKIHSIYIYNFTFCSVLSFDFTTLFKVVWVICQCGLTCGLTCTLYFHRFRIFTNFTIFN